MHVLYRSILDTQTHGDFTSVFPAYSQEYKVWLKVYGPISQNGCIYLIDVSSPTKAWFQISVKLVKLFGYKKRLHILDIGIAYT